MQNIEFGQRVVLISHAGDDYGITHHAMRVHGRPVLSFGTECGVVKVSDYPRLSRVVCGETFTVEGVSYTFVDYDEEDGLPMLDPVDAQPIPTHGVSEKLAWRDLHAGSVR